MGTMTRLRPLVDVHSLNLNQSISLLIFLNEILALLNVTNQILRMVIVLQEVEVVSRKVRVHHGKNSSYSDLAGGSSGSSKSIGLSESSSSSSVSIGKRSGINNPVMKYARRKFLGGVA